MDTLATIAIFGYYVWIHTVPAYFCWRKGKIGMAITGIFIPLVGVIGALRLAKPDSKYALRAYGPEKMQEASARYPDRAARTSSVARRDASGQDGPPAAGLARNARRVSLGAMVAAVLVSLLVGGGLVILLGDGEERSLPEANQVPPSEQGPPPAGDEMRPAPAPLAIVGIDEPVSDGYVTFRVNSIRTVDALAANDERGAPPAVRPESGFKLVAVRVTWRNESTDYRDIFCGNSSELLDVDGENWEQAHDTIYIEGNPTCGAGIGQGEHRTETLAFQLPKGRKVVGIALWDGADADVFGESYVVALLDFAFDGNPPDASGPETGGPA